MNAITISRIADLESILDAARQCARRVRLSAESGDMGPDEAAAILSESLATVTAWSNTATVELLKNSLPVAHEPAPPVPEALKTDLVEVAAS